MKGRTEHRHHWYRRTKDSAGGVNPGQTGRVVERSYIFQRINRKSHRFVNDCGPGEPLSSVNNPMPDRTDTTHAPMDQGGVGRVNPFNHPANRSLMIGNIACMTEDRLSFSLKGEKCDSADTLDYPAGQAHLTVISGRFRIDGRDQELERRAPTVDDEKIHSVKTFPVKKCTVPSFIAKASHSLYLKYSKIRSKSLEACSEKNPYTISTYR